MEKKKFEFGIIGLGILGHNLMSSLCAKDYEVLGYDKNTSQVNGLSNNPNNKKLFLTNDLKEFMMALKLPRIIMLAMPEGKVVDHVISELMPFLNQEDLILDFGNSHFTDTDKRSESLSFAGVHFMGVGISGAKTETNNGVCLMPGGPQKVYARVQTMLEAISAKVNNQPCTTLLGEGSVGHYVKMVHNGIENGIMQLIAETYHLLNGPGKMTNDELYTVFSTWNKGLLPSFLIELTSEIFRQKDDLTDNDLIDMILDCDDQKDTLGWLSKEGISLQVPISIIDVAVSMRFLSVDKLERETAQKNLKGPEVILGSDKSELLAWLEQTLYFSMVMTYAQGMNLLRVASKKYNYNLKLQDVAKIWRGGCIIRTSMLDDIEKALVRNPQLSNLMMDEYLSTKVFYAQKSVRKVIKNAVQAGVPMPAVMNALAYYDTYRSGWLPVNLIEAQRNNFASHTYLRNDREGVFNTKWN